MKSKKIVNEINSTHSAIELNDKQVSESKMKRWKEKKRERESENQSEKKRKRRRSIN